jgi:hypothetical protein
MRKINRLREKLRKRILHDFYHAEFTGTPSYFFGFSVLKMKGSGHSSVKVTFNV